MAGLLASIYYYYEQLTSMQDSLFGITSNAQMEQANVLDALPDPIIIVGADHPTYVNEEALKMLNCSAEMKDIQAMDDLS